MFCCVYISAPFLFSVCKGNSTLRSGTEYKASEIGKGYTLAHIEKTQKNLKYNSISRNYGNTLKPKDGGLHL